MSALKPPPEAEGWDVVKSRPGKKRPPQRKKKPPVTISARVSETHGDGLTINVNLDFFGAEPPPQWLCYGAKLWVARGRGEFLNTLRLLPNGDRKVARFARNARALRITVPPLEGHPAKSMPRTVVEFDFGDGWFDITLPDWHGPHPAKAPAAAHTVLARAAEAAGKQALALKPNAQPFSLAAGAASHPAWVSPKAKQEHERAVKGGAA